MILYLEGAWMAQQRTGNSGRADGSERGVSHYRMKAAQ